MGSLLTKYYPHFIIFLVTQVDISKLFVNFSAVREHSVGNVEMLFLFSKH